MENTSGPLFAFSLEAIRSFSFAHPLNTCISFVWGQILGVRGERLSQSRQQKGDRGALISSECAHVKTGGNGRWFATIVPGGGGGGVDKTPILHGVL